MPKERIIEASLSHVTFTPDHLLNISPDSSLFENLTNFHIKNFEEEQTWQDFLIWMLREKQMISLPGIGQFYLSKTLALKKIRIFQKCLTI